MEFIWEASPSLGAKAQMFTHVLHTHYSAPQVSKPLPTATNMHLFLLSYLRIMILRL